MEAAVVLALVGAGAGLIDSIVGDTNAYSDLAELKEEIKKLYALEVKDAEDKFNIAKEEANKEAKQAQDYADLTDVGQDIKETAVSFDFNNFIDSLYLSQKQDLLEWNIQTVNAGQSEGASYANIAGSGIRAGSSLSQAVELEAAANEVQLQFTQDAKRRSDENNLGSLLNNLAGNKYDIRTERVGADVTRQNALDLVNSYLEGGSQYKLYQNQQAIMKQQYENEISKIEREMDKHTGWNAFWNGVSAFFTMGMAGAQAGYTMGKIGTEAINYNTKGNLGNYKSNSNSNTRKISSFRSL